MSEPIVFISHVRVKAGRLDAVEQMSRTISERLEEQQPRTLAQLLYLDEQGSQMSVVYVFANAESMELHFEGADERARTASEYLDLLGFEIYGRPSTRILESMQREAAVAGVPVTVQPIHLAGFLRLEPT